MFFPMSSVVSVSLPLWLYCYVRFVFLCNFICFGKINTGTLKVRQSFQLYEINMFGEIKMLEVKLPEQI